MAYFTGVQGEAASPGKEIYLFGLTVLMQSSGSYLVSPLIISSACIFASLVD